MAVKSRKVRFLTLVLNIRQTKGKMMVDIIEELCDLDAIVTLWEG